MKLKYHLLALCACSMSFLSAQTATPEKPATGKKEEAVKEPKAEATAMKVGGMMEKFGQQMNEMEPTMSKYFQPDEEKDGQ